MTAARWSLALEARPPRLALEVLVPSVPVVIEPRPDDLVVEVVEFVPATGEVGLMLAELKARTPLFDWHEWWAQLAAAMRSGRPRQVEQLLAVATLNGWA